VAQGVLKVLKSVLGSLALASVLAISAGAATATTVTLKFEGPSADPAGSVKIAKAPVTPAATHVGAYGFRMTDVTSPESVLGSFIAWCLDIEHRLAGTGKPVEYTITSIPFTNSYGLDPEQRKRVQSVFDANYDPELVTDKNKAAGFQVALWDALYDKDFLASDGDFKVTGATEILTQANKYLASAKDYSGARLWNLTFLQSNEPQKVYQNLVTASPVPVPAAAWLMLLALGGLAAVGRRRGTI